MNGGRNAASYDHCIRLGADPARRHTSFSPIRPWLSRPTGCVDQQMRRKISSVYRSAWHDIKLARNGGFCVIHWFGRKDFSQCLRESTHISVIIGMVGNVENDLRGSLHSGSFQYITGSIRLKWKKGRAAIIVIGCTGCTHCEPIKGRNVNMYMTSQSGHVPSYGVVIELDDNQLDAHTRIDSSRSRQFTHWWLPILHNKIPFKIEN